MSNYYWFVGIAILVGFTGVYLNGVIHNFEIRQAKRIERLIDIIAKWRDNA